MLRGQTPRDEDEPKLGALDVGETIARALERAESLSEQGAPPHEAMSQAVGELGRLPSSLENAVWAAWEACDTSRDDGADEVVPGYCDEDTEPTERIPLADEGP